MQNLSKRKVRDEGDIEEGRMLKANHLLRSEEKAAQAKMLEQDQHGEFSIPGLRFATESWAGLKTSNEDRHASSVELFPGPVLGIFDGHGGTFSADFLSRQLVKTVSSTICQNVGGIVLADLQRSRYLSSQENTRKNAIMEQVSLLRQQLAELEAMQPDSEIRKPDNIADASDEVDTLLSDAISQLDGELGQIGVEEAARRVRRKKWCYEEHKKIVTAFKDAFERVDSQILQKNPSQDGSTALLVWFLADTLSICDEMGTKNDTADNEQQAGELSFYTANVGDCRAVMCRGGRGDPLTSDHKPDRPDEKQRIEKAGGFVGKIAGISRVYSAAGAGLAMQREASTYLAVSRAFGDRSLKTPTPLVSCEPEVKRFTVQADDLFLVLACDGVWDVLNEQDAVDIALPHFHDAKAAAEAIVKAAYRKGSVDNLTATVVQFGWKSDAQVQQAHERTKASKPSIPKGKNAIGAVDDGSEEEIDMFNL